MSPNLDMSIYHLTFDINSHKGSEYIHFDINLLDQNN